MGNGNRDAVMIAFGILLSLLTVAELYSSWRNTRGE